MTLPETFERLKIHGEMTMNQTHQRLLYIDVTFRDVKEKQSQ